MRRFTVYFPGGKDSDAVCNAWLEAGFKVILSEEALEQEQSPDAVCWRCSHDNSVQFRAVKYLLPKVYVIVCDQNFSPEVALPDVYEHHFIAAEEFSFTIGSRIQGIPAPPVWEAYRIDSQLPPELQIKAVADSAYRFLLEDVFRETAEWCGHMSSVVGPS